MLVTRIQSGGIRIKTSPEKFEEDFSTTYNIKAWGADNLFPNIFNNMIQASPTASTCVRKKARFIEGKGIEGGDAVMVNYSQTLNVLTIFDFSGLISRPSLSLSHSLVASKIRFA